MIGHGHRNKKARRDTSCATSLIDLVVRQHKAFGSLFIVERGQCGYGKEINALIASEMLEVVHESFIYRNVRITDKYLNDLGLPRFTSGQQHLNAPRFYDQGGNSHA